MSKEKIEKGSPEKSGSRPFLHNKPTIHEKQEDQTGGGTAQRAQNSHYLQRKIGNSRLGRLWGQLQTKLTVGSSNSPQEHEADQVARQVVNRSEKSEAAPIKRMAAGEEEGPAQPKRMQRQAAAEEEERSIQTMAADEEEPSIQKKAADEEEPVQRQGEEEEEATTPVMTKKRAGKGNGTAVPPTVEGGINQAKGKGQALPDPVRQPMEDGLKADFSGVRIHTDNRADQLNEQVQARAFTTGQDIFFKQGEYNPESSAGKELLAHELTHVVQQDSQNRLQRQEKVGSRVTHAPGVKSKFKKVTASFDGRTFTLYGDGKQLMQADGQSGKPLTVKPAHQKAFKGAAGDTYLNNPRYVAAKEYGPIPEGTFRFKAVQMSTFNMMEQAKILTGGDFTDPFGRKMHGGDWGAGRVPLKIVRVLRSKYGGSTRRRGGFYIHGGIMPGSAGCIDIGNAAFTELVNHLAGYKGWITVRVKYKHAAQELSWWDRLRGRITYPEPDENNQEPGIFDRLWSIFD